MLNAPGRSPGDEQVTRWALAHASRKDTRSGGSIRTSTGLLHQAPQVRVALGHEVAGLLDRRGEAGQGDLGGGHDLSHGSLR